MKKVLTWTTAVLLFHCLSHAQPEKDLLKDLATHHVQSMYGPTAEGMKFTRHEASKGVVVTLSGKKSKGVLSYLVLADIAVPTHQGTPQPDKKWYRARVLRIAGPQTGGWHSVRTEHLSSADYNLLLNIKSPLERPIEDQRLTELVRGKVLPERMQRPWKGEEWHDAEMHVRATTVHAYSFDFVTKVELGGNLMGVTLYVDAKGLILSRSEAMLHLD